MSDEPYSFPPIPLVTAARARDIARTMQAYALRMEELGNQPEARRAERRSAWWLSYALVLAQTQEGPQDGTKESE